MRTVPRLEEDPRWHLLQRIVSTPTFKRSPRLVSFLLFVSERSLTGDPSDINEQLIGTSLFGRADGYDSNDDNIVRSHASRLRQKLENYFEGEGSSENLRVSLPKGSYVPEFYRLHQAPLETPTGCGGTDYSSADAVNPGRTDGRSNQSAATSDHLVELSRPFTRSLYSWWLITSVACMLCVALTLLLTKHVKPPATPERPNHRLWETMLAGNQRTILVNGDSSLVIYENVVHKTLSIGEYLSGSYPDNVPPQVGVDPGILGTIARRRLTSTVDLGIVEHIASRPEFRRETTTTRFARDLRVDELKGTNLILIGAQEANPWIQLYTKSLNFELVADQTTKIFTVRNRKPRSGEQPEYKSISGDPERRAFAIAALVPNLNGPGRTLIIEGTGMAGTEAAADYLLDDEQLSSLLVKAGGTGDRLPNFEVLLETANLGGKAPACRLLGYRTY